jgi:hypothetical protein
MKKAMIIGLLLFGMNAQANPTTDPVEKTEKTSLHCHYKAEYYAIRAQYEDGKITLKQAQAKWQKAKERLKKEEVN